MIEKEQLGLSHELIGFEVAKSWGFPDILLQPILYHHNYNEYNGSDKNIKKNIEIVYLSDLITNILYSEKPNYYYDKFQTEAKKILNLSNDAIQFILDEVHIEIEDIAEYFGLKIKDSKSIQEILQEANIRLSLLNLNYDQINKELIKTKIALERTKEELEEKNKFLENEVNLDGLTGIYNHRYFQSTLNKEINRATRKDTILTLILIDIDHFKNFKDRYGHLIGDFILKQFSNILKCNLRNYDTVARYGGEEFAIILPQTNAEEGKIIADKLRKLIEST